MTYDELVEAIGRGQPEDWLVQGVGLVYKQDLNVRIEENDAMSRMEFHEPWIDDLPSVAPPERLVYWVYYGVTKVMEIHTVWVDGRTIVPLPDSRDRFSMSRWNYSFGKIVEQLAYPEAHLGGIYSLDHILNRAGIKVRDT